MKTSGKAESKMEQVMTESGRFGSFAEFGEEKHYDSVFSNGTIK